MRLLRRRWLRGRGFIPLFSQLISIHLYTVSTESVFVPCIVCESGARDHEFAANGRICEFLLRPLSQPRPVDTRGVAIRVFGLQLALSTLAGEDLCET